MKRHLKIFLIGISSIIAITSFSVIIFLIMTAIDANQKQVSNNNIANEIEIEKIAVPEEWEEGDGEIYNNISYGEKDTNYFNLYIPASADKNNSHAIMLFLHWGSWTDGSRSDMDYTCKYYAKAGYITAAMDYSLIGEEHQDVNFFMMMDEITACLAKIKQVTADMGYQVNKLAMSGFSSGGHLALLYSYSRWETSPIPLLFVFEEVGPVDFSGMSSEEDIESAALFLSGATGSMITAEMLRDGSAESAIRSISPISYIDENSPPTLMAYGGRDVQLDPAQPKLLAETLEQAGVPYIYVEFPNSNHGLYDDPECREEYNQNVLKFAKKYFGY